MTAVEGARCRNCRRDVDVRPCPFCGGNVMDFGRTIVEPPIQVTDRVTRTAQGVREKKSKWAIFALGIISGFDAFVILSNSNMTNLTIHLFLSIAVFISGYFAFVRAENLLRITMRRLFNRIEQVQNPNTVRRRCNVCNTEYEEHPCPECGSTESRIVAVKNETTNINEIPVAVRRNNFTKINCIGIIFLILTLAVQWYISFNNGGMINLTISSLMALILFIPSYYVFLKVYFTDTEEFQ